MTIQGNSSMASSLMAIEEEVDSIMTPGQQRVDNDAERLEIDEPRIMVPEEYDELKDLEQAYFENVVLEETLLFGGTLGTVNGGVNAIASTPNGKLVA